MTSAKKAESGFVPFDSSTERIRRWLIWLSLLVGCVWLTVSVFTGRVSGPVQIIAPVTDWAGVIDRRDALYIDRALRSHRDATGVQIAVLTVDTTAGVPIEDYSFQVAEAWGGGTAGLDNGVLFTLAVDDRRMRIEVGRGLEAQITDGDAARIIAELPALLRDGRYGAASARVVDRLIGLTGGDGGLEYGLPADGAPVPARGVHGGVAGALALGYGHGIGVPHLMLGLGLLIIAVLGFLRLTLTDGLGRAAAQARYFSDISPWPVVAICLVAGSAIVAGLMQIFVHSGRGVVITVPLLVGAAGLVLGLPLVVWVRKASLRHWRVRPRGCGEGDGMMQQVDPEGRAGGLTPGQHTEIAIFSRVYDVWICPTGHRQVESFPGADPAEDCPKCAHKTVRRSGWSTVQEATYSSAGRRERDVNCLHCNYSTVESQRIPRRERSSSSSSSGFSSGGGGGGGGWSGGGGSFGGGGASGSW